MPTITYYVAASMDGYIADADGGVDWLPQGESDDYGYAEFYASVDALVMGRRTYDQVLGFGQWPYAGKPSYVFTGHPPDDNPHSVEFVDTNPAAFVQTVASQYDGTVWLVGGGNLAEQFRRAGLIDEYLIFIIPVVLGRGIPLFGGDAPHTALELIETQTYSDGGVMLHYRPCAPLDSGSRPE
ncbi:MAG: dihydrofolate reductase [Chloroflexi bacterium]|nr:dihydrofolate reductase [Chloroflexota bacterium]